VWTITDADSVGNLTTSTYLAETDGDNLREVLIDGPRADGLRALPVAISSDHTQVFMDYHPDGVSAFTPFDQYAGLFSVNVDAGNVTLLPGEPGCFCGGAVGSETFLRLSLNLELNVFDVRVFNVIAGVERATLSGLELNYTGGAFTQAGDMLLSPDERYAVYALAQVHNFGTDFQSVRTVFALVDLQALTVRQISDPIIGFVHPAAFTENRRSRWRTADWTMFPTQPILACCLRTTLNHASRTECHRTRGSAVLPYHCRQPPAASDADRRQCASHH
jgi:hypothetical protein